MGLNLWFLRVYWADEHWRPCVWVRFPRTWGVVFFGWQRPSGMWMKR